MEILNKTANIFGLTDEIWMRHANKWSVWTRFFILPLLAAAVWAHIWIGWYSLVLIAGLLFWTWINPRFFSTPKTTEHWASKAVFGERVLLNKKHIPVPTHHFRAIIVLNTVTFLGLPFLVWGLYTLDIMSTILGLVITILGKMWFLDRMVWLYEDMKHVPEYKDWLY